MPNLTIKPAAKRRFLLAALAAGLFAGHAGPALADAAEDAVDYFRAVQIDNVGVVRRVLAKGLDPNIREPERGETGLIVAMRYEAKDTLKVLLAQPGIDLDAKAPNGNTALMMAAFRQNKPAVLTLLGAGASINQSGWTALHYAAAAGSIEISNLLLDRKAQIDAESPSGMTPLMLAAREGQEEIVKLLLARGADATLKDGGFHLTAAEFATKADKPWIAKAIQAHLAAQPKR
ncbi:ankyrin repeat domain-containing protein [Rugamonas sp. DEMB1]|uniref:ankyrin repeat domain-containing protein n=1 Tax=Rugamonas sp. DEMB1 TaxID=3039386 RepID=UPI002447F71A|nr:ankyrin repeat domain-containing protein [Rugamonas sp. DEMB1]WGG53110.1 ankyrin repeat domain-containing protein [Rugamonas sp. DEMB1]